MSTDSIPTFTLGDRLAKARCKAKISVAQMARTLRVSRGTISNYEHDRTDPPFSTIERYAQITRVPLWWLDPDESGPRDPADLVSPGSGCIPDNVSHVSFGASRQTQVAA